MLFGNVMRPKSNWDGLIADPANGSVLDEVEIDRIPEHEAAMKGLDGNAAALRAPDRRLRIADRGILFVIQVREHVRQVVGGGHERLLGELSRDVDHDRRVEPLFLAHPCGNRGLASSEPGRPARRPARRRRRRYRPACRAGEDGKGDWPSGGTGTAILLCERGFSARQLECLIHIVNREHEVNDAQAGKPPHRSPNVCRDTSSDLARAHCATGLKPYDLDRSQHAVFTSQPASPSFSRQAKAPG